MFAVSENNVTYFVHEAEIDSFVGGPIIVENGRAVLAGHSEGVLADCHHGITFCAFVFGVGADGDAHELCKLKPADRHMRQVEAC